MGLNESTGNMYGFVTHTWNPIKGCKHDCIYCYLKKMYGGSYNMEPRLDQKELEIKLGSGNTIFVGSASDMFGDFISDDMIKEVFRHCRKYPGNRYLFQSKNPKRFLDLYDFIPPSAILGTTIETNRNLNGFSKAPQTKDRVDPMVRIMFPKMISIEPVIEFDPGTMYKWILEINPTFVSMGADSKNCNLPEPSAETIKTLIRYLRKEGIEVILKPNLRRIIGEDGFYE